GFRNRLAPSARAPSAPSSRGRSGDSGVYGPRADGAHEPLDRLAQRSVRSGRHVLRNAHRDSSIHGIGSYGAGAQSYCEETHTTLREAEVRSEGAFGNYHEVARQDGRGALPDSG